MAITTDQELRDEMGKLASQDLPKTPVEEIAPKPDEAISDITLGETPTTTPVFADETALDVTVTGPSRPDLGQVKETTTVTPGLQELGGAQAAQLTPAGPYVDMTGVEGTVSQGSLAQAAQAELDPRATTQYQLGELMKSLETGGPMPPWAAPQVRKVNALMQARGLPASSMASAAVMQALMESGVQIASKDADKFATIQLANLNNRQQTALANAATYAAMDRANLSARLQGAVTEAQALLSVDLKNLDNKQKSDTLTYSSLVQGLFKDAAEENARKQFNAKNELQVEEYFAELSSQVETANANRTAAMRQFNTSEANAMSQFNTQVKDSREKFEAQMGFAVEQSNAVWRREINTANTAAQNEANRLDVMNMYNATMTAMSNMWQQMRDNASWNFTKSENDLARRHDLAAIAMQFANSQEMYSREQKDRMAGELAKFLANLVI